MTVSKPILFGGIAGLVVVVIIGLGYFAYASEHSRFEEIDRQFKNALRTIASYTQYAKHLETAKQALAENKDALTVAAVREQTVYLRVKKSPLVFRADAQVVLHLAVTYTFGFNLAPEKFELDNTPEGIVATMAPPILMAAPKVRITLVEVTDASIVLDEDKAAAELMKLVTENFAAKGAAMAKGDDVKALCEKKLIEFLRDNLEKQPEVKFVPGIVVKYQA